MPCNDLAAGTHPSLLRCLTELPGCSQHWGLLLCRGQGARAAGGGCWPWARCSLGSRHSSCPAGGTRLEMGTASPSSPLLPCAAASAVPSHGKKAFWVMGSSGDVGTPPIKGARTCARDPRRAGKGGEPELARSRAGPGRAQSSGTAALLPEPPSEGIWGSLHAVSRLQRCSNGIKGEAEGDADLEELLSRARLLPV